MTGPPFDVDALPTYEHIHATIPTQHIPPTDLVPTQSKLVIARLLDIHNGQPTEGPDPCIHVVQVGERRYVYNGHHRWAIALLAGHPTIPARITTEVTR